MSLLLLDTSAAEDVHKHVLADGCMYELNIICTFPLQNFGVNPVLIEIKGQTFGSSKLSQIPRSWPRISLRGNVSEDAVYPDGQTRKEMGLSFCLEISTAVTH